MIGHPPDSLFGEMAYLAWVAHWPHDQLMSMTHDERRRWLREFDRIAAGNGDPLVTGDGSWP
jgi:hypothetical protein